MQTITLPVTQIGADERRAFEHVLGEPLRDDQQVTISVAPSVLPEISCIPPLPEYFHVYQGMSDEEIAELEAVIHQRVNFRRHNDE